MFGELLRGTLERTQNATRAGVFESDEGKRGSASIRGARRRVRSVVGSRRVEEEVFSRMRAEYEMGRRRTIREEDKKKKKKKKKKTTPSTAIRKTKKLFDD